MIKLRERLRSAVASSIGPLYEYVGSLTKHEALLARDEEEFVAAFEANGGGEKPTLIQIREKAEEERTLRNALDAELPVRAPRAGEGGCVDGVGTA